MAGRKKKDRLLVPGEEDEGGVSNPVMVCHYGYSFFDFFLYFKCKFFFIEENKLSCYDV